MRAPKFESPIVVRSDYHNDAAVIVKYGNSRTRAGFLKAEACRENWKGSIKTAEVVVPAQ